MSEWQEPSSEPRIVKIEGTPKADEKIPRRGLLWRAFKTVADGIVAKSSKAVHLGEAYVEAKVAQEENAAKKTTAEAAEIAARREGIEADTEIKRQEAAAKFAGVVKQIAELPPGPAQVLALAKLAEQNPGVMEQIDELEKLLETLRLTRGLAIAAVPKPATAIAGNVEESETG